MVEIVISVAAKVAEYMVDPIRRHLSYLFKPHHHVEHLIQQIDNLDLVRETVANLVEDARRQGDEVIPRVMEWLEDAQGIIQRKEGFAEDEKQASKSCFHLKPRYRLSKKAEKQTQDIDAKLQQARVFGDTVSRPPPPPPLISSASSQHCEAFPSRQSTFDQIMVALRNEETSMVGLWGMGGVGKTTVALQVAERARDEKLFHKVLMASSISETTNISEIQREIARTLGLTFPEGEDRAVRLKSSLKNSLKNQETILVILDDIWNKLDLEKIGIPYGYEYKGCKLLLTSRDLRVLDSDMEAQQVFHLRHLNAEEAWSLFKRTAGDCVESPEIKSTADEIVKHCEGLPIAIVTIANALKKKGAAVWKNGLEELKNAAPTNIRGVSEKVYSCLELSYNHLESDEAKSLFLLCGLLEDAHISMDRLLLYCMGLDLFKESHWEKGTNKLITLVGSLKDSSLLLDPDQERDEDEYGSLFFNDAFVKMHDVVRDVARSIGSKDACQCVVREASELRKWERTDECRNYTRISLNCGDRDELPQKLVCPKLELLLNSSLDRDDGPRYKWTIPDGFFQETKQLRVLHLSGVSLGPSPSFLGFLSNLRALCLNGCQLYDLSWATIGELKQLQVLSLAESEIIELPEDMMQLRDLRVLDLRHCGLLCIIPRNVLSSLSRLEYLSLKGCSGIKWERDGVNRSGERNMKACLSEIKHLPQLKTLEVEVSDPRLLPEDELLFHNDVNLSRYSIAIGETRPVFKVVKVQSGASRYLELRGVEKESQGAVLKCVSKLLRSCQGLSLVELGDIKEVVYELGRDHGFVELEYLDISECPNIECILGSRRDHQYWVPPCNTLCTLEKLHLSCLHNLEAVCQGPIPVGCFRNLRGLYLWFCKRLNYVFASSQYPTMELAFPHLQTLNLNDLPELISFSSSTTTAATTAGSQDTIPFFNAQISFPTLKSLTVDGLNNTQALWEKQLASTYFLWKLLKEISIVNCPKLQSIFPLCVAKALVQLKNLTIHKCYGVKAIVVDEEEYEPIVLSTPLILFPKLTRLELHGLPQLKRFYSRRFALRWPALKRLEVCDCHQVEVMFQGLIGLSEGLFLVDQDAFPALDSIFICDLNSMRALWYGTFSIASFPKLERLDIMFCKVMNEIVTSHEDETTSASSSLFPNLSSLKLTNLPQLKKFGSKSFDSRWPRLKSLKLKRCDKVEILFVQEASVEGGLATAMQILQHQPFFFLHKDAFPALESISIQSLDGMRALWHSPQISADFFPRLKELKIYYCRKLLNVFPLFVAKALGQLELLQIGLCEAVEEIVTSQEDETVTFLSLLPNLTTLVLEHLPQVQKFCSKRFASRWPLLKSLTLRQCNKVEILFVQETSVEGGLTTTEIQQPFFFLQKEAFPALESISISYSNSLRALWYSPQISANCFPRLKELDVNFCGELLNIFPLSVAKALGQLKRLWIASCEALEEIVSSHEDETEASSSLLPNLTTLELEHFTA